MADEPATYTTHANVNVVETGLPDGTLLRLEGDHTFKTSDARVIAYLDASDLPVKRVTAPSGRKADKDEAE